MASLGGGNQPYSGWLLEISFHLMTSHISILGTKVGIEPQQQAEEEVTHSKYKLN